MAASPAGRVMHSADIISMAVARAPCQV